VLVEFLSVVGVTAFAAPASVVGDVVIVGSPSVVGDDTAPTVSGERRTRPSPDEQPVATAVASTTTCQILDRTRWSLRPLAPSDGSGAGGARLVVRYERTHRVGAVTCDSCGADADQLQAVHRKYVTPGSWDQDQAERVVDEVERWCFACLTHYPHELA
jgi:hypothetical protein